MGMEVVHGIIFGLTCVVGCVLVGVFIALHSGTILGIGLAFLAVAALQYFVWFRMYEKKHELTS